MINSKENLRNIDRATFNFKVNEIQLLSVEKENYVTPDNSACSPAKTKWQKYAKVKIANNNKVFILQFYFSWQVN